MATFPDVSITQTRKTAVAVNFQQLYPPKSAIQLPKQRCFPRCSRYKTTEVSATAGSCKANRIQFLERRRNRERSRVSSRWGRGIVAPSGLHCAVSMVFIGRWKDLPKLSKEWNSRRQDWFCEQFLWRVDGLIYLNYPYRIFVEEKTKVPNFRKTDGRKSGARPHIHEEVHTFSPTKPPSSGWWPTKS